MNEDAKRKLTQKEINEISRFHQFEKIVTYSYIDFDGIKTEKVEQDYELDDFELISIIDYNVFDFTDKYNYREIQDDYTFHPNGKTFTMVLDDNYFLGIRCDHLVFVEGYREGIPGTAFLVIGNHKGITVMKILQANYKFKREVRKKIDKNEVFPVLEYM